MIKSMTAFGRSRQTVGGKETTVEIRSVNSRYFECSVRISRAFGYLEEKIKPYLQSKGISRGKVDVGIVIDVVDSQNVEIEIDEGYAKGYITALESLRDKFGLRDDISVMSVAHDRAIFTVKKPEEDTERDWQELLPVLDEALEAFLSGRAAEGSRLEDDIRKKVAGISEKVDKIEQISRKDIEGYRQKLSERLHNMLADNNISMDESRILTECAIFADKVAIDEEIVRLRSHFAELENILASSEPVGRRLDFLLQEMNREVNTTGSKCSDSEIAHLVVDIKCELEKIREQIQNIE